MSALPDQFPGSRSTPPGARSSSRHALIKPMPVLQVGAGLGLAGVLLGFAILLIACAGFDAAMAFSPAVIALGISSALLCLVASFKPAHSSDVPVLACAFVALLAMAGGGLEFAAWMRWPILFTQH